METETQKSLLQSLSNALADAVDIGARSVVTVHGRRRMPASGMVWSADGLIVSASHVVERDDDLSVTLPDGETQSATLVGRDPGTDIVLLKLDSSALQSITPAPSPARPGSVALAVGRPGVHGPMASLGVISMVGGPWRNGKGSQLDTFIRSDAAMLPGFSGGPLIDAQGEVFGMNSSSVGRRGGLTIPCQPLGKIIAGLASHGKIRRGYLGIGAQSAPLNTRLAADLGLEQERGLVVVSLESAGPAETAGLLLGDVLLSINGHPVASVEELQNQLTGESVGSPSTLKLVRGGALHQAEVVAAERM